MYLYPYILALQHNCIIDTLIYKQLPEPELDDWTHDVTVNLSSSRPLPLGERCTFFGCFVYCNLESCQRVYRHFLEGNVVIDLCFIVLLSMSPS